MSQSTTDTSLSPADEAVNHILRRLLDDPRVAYYLGWGTESFRLLCAAHAWRYGLDPEQFEKEFAAKLKYEKPPTCPDECPHCGAALYEEE